MNLVPAAITRLAAQKSLQLHKNSPTLLFGVGVASMVGSTVLACRATLKVEEVLLVGQNNLEVAKNMDHPEYSEQDRSRDISLIYIQTSVQVLRLYAPAVFLGAAGLAALTRSQRILNERNAALMAAYAALEKGFNEYRERVVEKYGEDEDRRLRFGSRQVEVENPETKKKELVERVPAGMPSIYARFFDWKSSSWSGEQEYNYIFLRCQQNYANDMLKARGHIFLNEVYDMLGLERSSAGAVVGWVLNNRQGGDNYVDFGCFDQNSEIRPVMLGDENEILLDFNVDGVVWDLIDSSEKELPRGN